MTYMLLLSAGTIISCAHFYLVWKNKDGVRYSISEHAIADTKSHALYLAAHFVTDILFVLFAYSFFWAENNLAGLFYLVVAFAGLDLLQAVLPSKGKTEALHFAAAYVSWFLYQLVGVLALFKVELAQPYLALAVLSLVPVIGMFVYMHFDRSRLWPYQLMMVPLYVLFLLFLVIGSRL